MVLLRYVALLGLVLWVGGLFALGAIAARAAIDEMAARQIADGRLLAGAVFGEILRRFFIVSSIAAGVIFLSLVARRILRPQTRRFGWGGGPSAPVVGAA